MTVTTSTLAWLLVCVLGVSAVASAQSGDFAPVGPFVFLVDDKVSLKPDGSYLFQHTDGDLVFEAQIAPDIRIVDNFGRALDRYSTRISRACSRTPPLARFSPG